MNKKIQTFDKTVLNQSKNTNEIDSFDNQSIKSNNTFNTNMKSQDSKDSKESKTDISTVNTLTTCNTDLNSNSLSNLDITTGLNLNNDNEEKKNVQKYVYLLKSV